MKSKPHEPPPLDWLNPPELRAWFARWLCAGASDGRLLQTAPPGFSPADSQRARARLQRGLNRLRDQLPALTAAEQLQALDDVALGCELRFDREAAIDLLHFDLVNTPPTSPPKPTPPEEPKERTSEAMQAWEQALQAWKQGGRTQALENWKRSVTEWGALRAALAALAASPWCAERALLKQFRQTTARLCRRHYPGDLDCQRALRHVMLGLAKFCPDHQQSRAVDEHKSLARFLVALLHRDVWPRVPAGFDTYDLGEALLEKHWLDFLHGFLGSPQQVPAGAGKLWGILHDCVADEGLRNALARLAFDADRRKKGPAHLRKALADAFALAIREPGLSEEILYFEMLHAHELSGLPRQARMAEFERATKRDLRYGGGQSSDETLYRRAMKAAARETTSA